jgi:UTP--glucose-1-phosphate uridylyltransferase
VARGADGRLVLRESAQCAPEDVAAFQDVRRHRYFNTNNLWVDLDVLARLLDERHGILGLSLIVNEKPVDPQDPKSPRVIQLETAMGAALGVFPGARVLRVPRARLVPVKTTSDLLALWSDAYDLGDDFRVVVSPRRRAGDFVVDLDPAYYRTVDDLTLRFPEGAPSLVGCRRFVVRGDVRFGAGVVVEGDVAVRHEGSSPRHVPAGTVLRG